MLETFAGLGSIDTILILAAMLLGGAFFLPIPEDLPLLLAGAAAQQGKADLWVLFIVCYTSVIVGDLILYGIGRWFGVRLVKWRWIRDRISITSIRKVRSNLHKRVFWTIIIARHLFYLRTVTFISCGILRMSFIRFLVADLVAALISAPLFMAIGYYASEHLDEILKDVDTVKHNLLLGGLFFAAVAVCWYLVRKKKQAQCLEAAGK